MEDKKNAENQANMVGDGRLLVFYSNFQIKASRNATKIKQDLDKILNNPDMLNGFASQNSLNHEVAKETLASAIFWFVEKSKEIYKVACFKCGAYGHYQQACPYYTTLWHMAV